MEQAQDNDVPMEAAPTAEPEAQPEPEPSPRDKALEAFKKKLIDHREYDNKLKNRMYFTCASNSSNSRISASGHSWVRYKVQQD